MTVTNITLVAAVTMMVEQGYDGDDIGDKFSWWVKRGDVILIFTNLDLSHPRVGHVIAMPWSLDSDGPFPPHAPDHNVIGLGWRYVLTHTVNPKEPVS